jgi:type I restriction enzyme S subunit
MSNVIELIEEIFPKGIQFRPLGELVRIRNGKDYKHLDSGTVPVYGSGGVMTHVAESFFGRPSVLIPRKGSLGNLFYVDTPFWTVDTIFYTEIGALLEPKFLYYFLRTVDLAGMNLAGGVPSLTQTTLNKILIPQPPLEVQREIVSILDKFTQLEAELEAELEARSRAFQFYCDNFFLMSELGANTRTVTLGESGSFVKGSGLQKTDFTASGMPCIHYGQIHTTFGSSTYDNLTSVDVELFRKLKKAKPGDVVIADTAEDYAGVGKGTAWLGDFEVAVGGHALIYSHQFDPLFISYFLRSHAFQTQKNAFAKGVKVKDISASAMSKIKIPDFEIEKQKSIGQKLKKLDDLVNDGCFGLSAEIEARRKQYEYYRTKLLTFKRLETV